MDHFDVVVLLLVGGAIQFGLLHALLHIESRVMRALMPPAVERTARAEAPQAGRVGSKGD